MTEPVDFSGSAPRSSRFDDTYFSAEDGLAESRLVFLQGCGLPDAWRGQRHFTVAELGFGTGLNILALLDLWARERPSPNARLHIFSVEGFPMAREDASRALTRWPELAEYAAPLLERWPDRGGWRRYDWPDLGATLDLAVGEVGAELAGWTGRANAWFLDGCAPARNPEMWRDEVLALVADRSAPGARAASFTVAGAVRRGLETQGFAVERVPGFGRKKQRLEARLPGSVAETAQPRVAILGAGIAGASLARAFRALGTHATVFDPQGPGAAASGNAAALVTPRLDAGFGAPARLHAEAFDRAVQLYRETPEAIIATGALQLERSPRDGPRFDRLGAWDGFAVGGLARLDPAETAQALDEPGTPGALAWRDALVIDPRVVLDAWLGPVERRWPEPDEADITIIALGAGSAARLPNIPLQPVRGQTSVVEAPFTGLAAAWGGYCIPTRSGLLFGATHERGEAGDEVRAEDAERNLGYLAEGRPGLAERIKHLPTVGRAAVRAATPDHMPVAGRLSADLYVLTGLGGRGFTLAPILGEAVAAMVLGRPGPLAEGLLTTVAPDRFG